jgi:hypothetical protein
MDDATLLLWTERGKIVAGLLVAIGVAGEFLGDFIARPIIKRRDDAQKAEIARLNKEAAELNKQAEDERAARLELERKIAARRLTGEQQARIASELGSLAGQHATVVFNDSFEAAAFASQIESALKSAKWVTRLSPLTPSSGLPVVSGVLIMTEPPDRSIAAGAALLAALRKQEVKAATLPFDRPNADQFRRSTDPEDSRVLVIVGSHP